MLRMVLNARRRTLEPGTDNGTTGSSEEETQEINLMEPWQEFLKRTARWTEEHLKHAGQREWLEIWRHRQWRWACKLVATDSQKWSAIATSWQPPLHSRSSCGRAQARPKKRWDQDIIDFLALELPDNRKSWHALAGDGRQWLELSDKFVERMNANLAAR